jgi:hypothetical protein
MYLCSQQEFKLALLLMMSIKNEKFPSSVKDLLEFKYLIKTGIPTQFEKDIKSNRNNQSLVQSSQILGQSFDEKEEKIKKELEIAKIGIVLCSKSVGIMQLKIYSSLWFIILQDVVN